MPSNVQIHRQVPPKDAKILKETKTTLYKLLQIYDTTILKSDNDIGQTNLIKMHIATRPDAAPVAARSYPLALKHHNFLIQEIKIYEMQESSIKIISPWASPIVVVKNTHLKVHHSSSTCA